MINSFLVLFGKSLSFILRLLNLGSGSTWPGHIVLNVNKNFIRDVLKHSPTIIVLIAGTNGKTTTSKLIQTILETNGNSVFRNAAGANLLNGIASSIVLHSSIVSKLNYEYAIFEVDENILPLALNEITPDYVILLNIFRDQLDRYGETDAIAKKWQKALSQLNNETTLTLNADDPQIAFLGSNETLYFGLNNKKLHQSSVQYAVDSTYCPKCSSKLIYETVYFSHLGDWRCSNCENIRPKLSLSQAPFYPLPGVYNQYNTLAAVLFAKSNNINNRTIEQSLKTFKPAFGRQEELEYQGKKVKLFLSKNPTSFNESLRTISELGAKNLLIVLNDRIPDGRDVSWIWDVDFEEYLDTSVRTTVSGDRAYDMGLRLKYAMESQKSKVKSQNFNLKVKIFEDLRDAVHKSLDSIRPNGTLYILPTYSAMLEVRKILIGKKLL